MIFVGFWDALRETFCIANSWVRWRGHHYSFGLGIYLASPLIKLLVLKKVTHSPLRIWMRFKKNCNFKLVLLISIVRYFYDHNLRWTPRDFTDDKSTLVPSCNKPLPEVMLILFYVSIWRHGAIMFNIHEMLLLLTLTILGLDCSGQNKPVSSLLMPLLLRHKETTHIQPRLILPSSPTKTFQSCCHKV